MKKGILFPAFLVIFSALILSGCPKPPPDDDVTGGGNGADDPTVTHDADVLPEGEVEGEDPYEVANTYADISIGDNGGNGNGTAVVEEDPYSDEGARDADTDKLSDAFFDYNRHNIRSDARAVLLDNARILKENPDLSILIEGHCDERGTITYNVALGERRARSAKNFLVDLGVDADRIETISYGKEKPFCFEHGEPCWQENRRSHFVIQ